MCVFKATISKLPAPLSCVAFANLDAFALCFRWPGGSGQQRCLREGAVPGRGPALRPAGPQDRGALRAVPRPGYPALRRHRWQDLPLDPSTVTHVAFIAFHKRGLTTAVCACRFIARVCTIRGIFALTEHYLAFYPNKPLNFSLFLLSPCFPQHQESLFWWFLDKQLYNDA